MEQLPLLHVNSERKTETVVSIYQPMKVEEREIGGILVVIYLLTYLK